MGAGAVPWEVDCQTVHEQLQRGTDLLLIDCREPDEHAIVHIEGARLIPLGELTDRLAELAPYRGQPIAVHCHHGGRSLKAAVWLRQQGFERAQSMAGRIDRWAMEIEPSLPRY